MHPPMPETRPKPSRLRWIAFFVLLALLAAAGITVPILYNLSKQLQPAQVAAARALWEERGPRDYDLQYQVKIDRDPVADEYLVEVRGGRVVLAACNGELLCVD